jgi:hypothetical protein
MILIFLISYIDIYHSILFVVVVFVVDRYCNTKSKIQIAIDIWIEFICIPYSQIIYN